MSVGYIISKPWAWRHHDRCCRSLHSELVAFDLLGWARLPLPSIAYGPVTDNAQSVMKLSLIEQFPGFKPS